MEAAVEPVGGGLDAAAMIYKHDDCSNTIPTLEDVPLSKDQFYKTKLCIPFASGLCRRGKSCCFAHGEGELRRPLNLRKTKLCQAWVEGRCPHGSECTFAHGEEDLRATADYYKTSLCKFWKRGLPCEAGADCRHAHGNDEIRERAYRRTERDKREAKTSSKSSSEADFESGKNSSNRWNKRQQSRATDQSSDFSKKGSTKRKPVEKNSDNFLVNCCEENNSGEQSWENGIDNLEAVVDELLIDSTSFQQCHSMSSPALATNSGIRLGTPCLQSRRSNPWKGTLSGMITDMDSTSDLHGCRSTVGSSQGHNSPNLTVDNILTKSPSFNAGSHRPSKKPALYIVTEGNPEFDPSAAVTIIIDGECVNCNVEEVRLMRSNLSSNPQFTNEIRPTSPIPSLGPYNYRLSDILQMLDPRHQ